MKYPHTRKILLIIFIAFSITIFIINPFASMNYLLQDILCLNTGKAQSNIFVIGIDDKSLNSIGPWNNWKRSIMADLINTLNKDASNRPLAIGVDVMYFGSTENDFTPAMLSKWDNLVFASKLNFTESLYQLENSSYQYDRMHLNGVELPSDSITTHSSYGFTNVFLDKDGFVRRALLSAEADGKNYYNFAYQIYRTYSQNAGILPQQPAVDKNNMYTIPYCAQNGAYYSNLSFIDVMDGTVPTELFRDSIVLVGAYAPGMLDSYYTPVDRSNPMYGVEINANIVQALCQNKVLVNIPLLPQLIMMAVLLLLCAYFYTKETIIKNTALLISAAGYLLFTALLSRQGYLLEPLYLPLMSFVLYIYMVIHSYVQERHERLRTLDTFKRYVSPEIAKHLIAENNTSLVHPQSNRRQIAVMFIDIRGFTPLSESLNPEEVADILNEYLTLTSSAIFKNGGTVDKFIGDATMALFNAPVTLEDYIYKAVKTAVDIQQGGNTLSQKFENKYGKEVRFGIGINCGDAVVGSIGADFRMDYTAIGDTVNTAARLESNAKRGQILVSETVYHALSTRVEFTYVGELNLKGKTLPAKVYQVDRLL